MDKLLKAMYDNFYVPPHDEELEHGIDECHQQLIERLEKPERKLVLQIIDDMSHIAYTLSLDSFIAGFHLAWTLSTELANQTRPYVPKSSSPSTPD